MTFKSSGKKISTVCSECNKLLREQQAYYTVEIPPRRLCRLCMAIYLDIKEFP